MSLTSTLAAQIEPIISHEEEVPPLPASLGVVRKQKSLKTFFFSASPPTEKRVQVERRSKGPLSWAKSKPSLRIDFKAPKESPSPGLATASSSGQADGYPDTPTSRSSDGGRGLSKRFSLSKMSAAFKKKPPGMAGLEIIPSVPELPEAY